MIARSRPRPPDRGAGQQLIWLEPPVAARRRRRHPPRSETTPNTQALEYARYVDEHFIQKGRLGVTSGQGFYSYPNPAFAQPGFI
jgi:hypothetical protein